MPLFHAIKRTKIFFKPCGIRRVRKFALQNEFDFFFDFFQFIHVTVQSICAYRFATAGVPSSPLRYRTGVQKNKNIRF